MKTAKRIVGFFAAASGVVANIAGWKMADLNNFMCTPNLYFDDMGVLELLVKWFTLLSILLWIVFVILLVIPTKKPVVKKKK